MVCVFAFCCVCFTDSFGFRLVLLLLLLYAISFITCVYIL
uniref:Uncharacterized protein n=1 Tax=Arundo donax TaxID=35708 RepID=A0A0A9GU11_ARUDO